MLEDGSVQDVVLVTQLPSDSWFEGFALRPNGKILTSRLDEPELYTFYAEDPDSTPELIYNFEEHANGLINVCPLPGGHDTYLVLSAIVDLVNITFEEFIVWRVQLSPDDSSPPEVTKVCDIQNTGFSIGLIPVTERIFLVPDSFKNCIWRLDIQTAEVSLFVADDTMKAPPGEGNFFGLNRMRITKEFLWFTNTSAGMLCRIPIELDESEGIRTTGGVQIVADDIPHCDGLTLSRDQTSVYTVSYMDGHVWKVSVDPETGKATTSVVMRSLASPTAVELYYFDDKPKMYIVCCGEIEMNWFVQDSQNPWSAIANINSAVTVTAVTVEETIE
ncbi:uncharacterized protein F4807DRAFT_442975 [Annulohypoxylon truncatum]|uniref:uncharacterized protein n=1 Tax=Annulohypoxylon truncatum TaxID=327061 RepID=UPI0020074098|nr:uncharacterized protein F4807DRAFT_442975 [Annulohypoxylon truncatum]KAI1205541.1 hypothetical protein F4807DRAFT_442975 [Annulohypoxylon truncatum]